MSICTELRNILVVYCVIFSWPAQPRIILWKSGKGEEGVKVRCIFIVFKKIALWTKNYSWITYKYSLISSLQIIFFKLFCIIIYPFLCCQLSIIAHQNYTYINLYIYSLFVYLFVSTKRKNDWTERAQIFCRITWPREGSWILRIFDFFKSTKRYRKFREFFIPSISSLVIRR